MELRASSNQETERLEILRGYTILDSPAEQTFDDLTALAADICQAPIALITLVDEDRQWFKSRIGLNIPETTRAVSFCSHAIKQTGIMIVPDALSDPRFASNPLVTADPHIRFYAGAPLISPEGAGLGTLCIIDRTPRKLAPAHEKALSILSRHVMTLLEARRQEIELVHIGEEKKRLSQILSNTKEQFHDLLENANDMIQSVTSDGRFLFVNRAWRKTLGYTDEEISSLSVFDIIHPESRQHCEEAFGCVMAGGKVEHVEAQFVAKNGHSIWVEGSANCRFIEGQPSYTTGIFRDITNRKKANAELKEAKDTLEHTVQKRTAELKKSNEDLRNEIRDRVLAETELKEREQLFHLAARASNDAISDWRIAEDRVWWSEGYSALIGGKFEAFEENREQWRQRLHPEDRNRVLAGLESALSKGEIWWDEYRYRRLDGTYADICDRGLIVRDTNGRPLRMIGGMSDITQRKGTERGLRHSEERYRSLVTATAQIVWTTDALGVVVEDSPSWRGFTGQSYDEFKGRGWLDALHPEDRERSYNLWARAVRTRTLYESEFRLRRADNQWRDVLVRAVPLIANDGRIREWIGFCMDITERKRTEKMIQRERLLAESVINSLPGIFFLADANGALQRWNHSLETLSGYSSAEVARMHPADFFAELDREKVTESLHRALSTGYASHEAACATKSGQAIPLYLSGLKIDYGGKPCVIGMGFDISDRKEHEAQMQRWNEELELRVSERTVDLQNLNHELETFCYSVSHDLRAPLRAISGLADIIVEEDGPRLSAESHDCLRRIIEAGKRMSRLIEDLLDYSRIGRGAIHFKSIPLQTLFQSIVHDFDPKIREVGADIIIDPNLPSVWGDTSLCQQIFSNLFENALLYRRPEVPPRIRISACVQEGWAVICVDDNGIGILPEHRERIFAVFQRLNPESNPLGTGIGLANARKAVEKLGGTIWMEPAKGVGSRFCVQLRLA